MSTQVWEDFVAINVRDELEGGTLLPPANYRPGDATGFKLYGYDLDVAAPLAADTQPLPLTKDREGYHGDKHFDYWLSGQLDWKLLVEAMQQSGGPLKRYLDIGCASGRVIRHAAADPSGVEAIGSDINRLHVEWCNRHLDRATVFHSSSVPSLPLEDNSVDLVSAFSVFTHIEAFETAWLMEIRRILRKGGLAWLTVHTEHTLRAMNENWPLYPAVMNHPEAARVGDRQSMDADRMVFRWSSDRSYSSNVFYRSDYLTKTWGKIMDVVELKRQCPSFQDVMLLRKR